MDGTTVPASPVDSGARHFKLDTIEGRGFAMGHRHNSRGTVSLSLMIGGGSFSLDAVSIEEALALAAAISAAADFAEGRS